MGYERPLFAQGFPRDPDLDRLLWAFVRGNHAYVRAEAENLAARTDDPKIAAASREIRRRIEPDRVAYVLYGTTALLLAALAIWAIRRSHDHAEPGHGAPTATSVKPPISIRAPTVVQSAVTPVVPTAVTPAVTSVH